MKLTSLLIAGLCFSLILQAQVLKTLSVTAGGLTTSLTTEEKNTVTNLTLTGTIDARDFKTMRDNMPVLAEIDLSGVNVVAYSGTDGTSLYGNTNYPADAIPESAFKNKINLKIINFPSNLTIIGQYAFSSCFELTEVSIPLSVTTIENSAFSNCGGFSSILIPLSVNTIQEMAFFNFPGSINVDDNNPNFSDVNGVLYDKNQTTLIQCPVSKSGSFKIPSTVINIGNHALSGSLFSSIEISTSVKTIEDYAFFNCLFLTSIEIPSNVTKIGDGFFSFCDNLSSIKVNWSIPPDLSTISGVFSNVNKSTCILYVPFGTKKAYQSAYHWQDFINIIELCDPNSINVTAGQLSTILTTEQLASLTKLALIGAIDARDFKTMRDNMPLLEEINLSWVSIIAYTGTEGTSNSGNTNYPANTVPESAFESKKTLKNIIIPNTTTEISQKVFLNSGLQSVALSPSLLTIQDQAFGWCYGLGSIALPESLTYIGYQAFAATNLTLIDIPKAVDFIGTVVFSYCRNLKEINVSSLNGKYSSIEGVLFNKDKTILVEYPDGIISPEYTIPFGVTKISVRSFTDSKPTKIIIPEGVLHIGFEAFTNMSGLHEITIPSSVTIIEGGAFAYNNNLTSIYSKGVKPLSLTAYGVFDGINKSASTLYVPFGSRAAYSVANQWKDFQNIVEMPGFNLSSNTITLTAAKGSTATVNISSDVTWTAISDQTWLTISPATGTGSQIQVNMSATEANATTKPKIATVTIAADGIQSQTITVTQVGVPISVTAGNLINMFTVEELASITYLKLTGKIDARDFKTMRDKMPLLAKLDLSGVEVVAYQGTDGTYPGTDSYAYSANSLPLNAFLNKNSLTSIILPSSLNSIAGWSLQNCTGLTGIAIPQNVTTIGTRAFSNCSNVGSIYTYSIVPVNLNGSTNVFYNINKTTCQLYVPFGSKAAYQAAYLWKDFTNIIEMPGVNLSVSAVNIEGSEGSSTSINIFSSTNWTAISDQTWLTVSPETGNTSGVLTFTGSANNGLVSRTATVTVSAPGFDSKVVTVTQIPVIREGNIKMLSLFEPQVLSRNRAFCGLSNNEPITVRILNDGTVPVSNFGVEYWVNGNKITQETYSGTINQGDTLKYTFGSKYNFSYVGYFRSFNLELKIIRPENNQADNILKRTVKEFGTYSDMPNWITYNSCDGILSDVSWAIAEDKNGNIWSTDYYGASKFDGTNWTTYTNVDGLGDNYSWAMINDKDGNIWFSGAASSVITKFDGSSFIQYPQAGRFEECIYADSKGNIWFGSYSGDGVLKFDGTNWIHYTSQSSNLGSYVISIGEDKNGNMFFGTSNGVIKYDGISWSNFALPGGISYVSEIFFDSKSNTWFTSGSNFIKYNGDGFVQFTSADGTIGSCDDITEDKYGNLWFGGGNEVVKYDGDLWTKYTPSDGMAAATSAGVFALHADKNGDIWVGTYGGGISKFVQSNTCPKHFHTVWEGTSATDYMTINLVNAKLDGADLEVGDEVGVFDGNLCVGYGKITQTVDNQHVLTITVSKDGGSGNGYTSGHEVSYMLWDCSTSTEFPVQFVQCFDNVSTLVLCSPFTVGATAFVSLEAFTIRSQQVALNAGWNIMSVSVMPDNPSFKNILQPLITGGNLKKVMDEGGAVIEDWGEINGGWQNTIGEIKNTEGYKINVTSDVILEITGMPLLLPFDIQLTEGWNIISWPSSGEQDGIDVFHDLIVAGKLKKVMDEGGYIIEDWGVANGSWQNFIGNLKPGEGYKVNVTSDCTLTINESGTKSEEIVPELIVSTHFIPAYKGNGTDHMNINLLNLAESGIMEGDEIGIFDGDICVGSAQISNLTSFNVNRNSISIPVSAADGIELKNGYSEGNPITLKLYRNGIEHPLTIQPLNQSKTVFEKGSSLFVQLALPTGIEGIIKGGITDVKVYPNPFSDEVNIEINLSTDAQVQVEVLNQLGQRISTITTKQLLTGGMHKLTWNGRNTGNGEAAPGIYHVRIEIDDSVVHRKIVLTN